MLKVIGLGLGFRDTDGRHLGIKKRGPRKVGVIHLAAAAKHGVLEGDFGLGLGRVCVLVALQDVADREDADRVSLQQFIDLDTVFRVSMDSHGLEVQVLDVGEAGRGAEDLCGRDLSTLAGVPVLVNADFLIAALLDVLDQRSPLDGDALSGEHAGDVPGDFGILAGEHPVLIGQNGHFRSEPGEDLGELHADRTGPDDGQALGHLGERPE